MNNDLKGKSCFIIGASSGIGAAIAEHFGRLGVRLVIHCNENRDGADAVATAIRAAGEGKSACCRPTSPTAKSRLGLLMRQLALLGGLDILINNAGSMFGRTSIADATDEQYERVISVNIGGVLLASRRAAAIMRAAPQRHHHQHHLDRCSHRWR